MTTNVTRLLAASGIRFETREYEVDERDLSGVRVARQVGLEPERVFKTLVLEGPRAELLVCVIPCAEALDLKKAARAAGLKSCAMLPMKDLPARTGYIRGGCSPIGMKKKLPTFIDETALIWDAVAISAGVRGTQLLIAPDALISYVDAATCDLIEMGGGIE